MPNASHGLTLVGLVRLNQSIEAFIYCVLGSQVATKRCILDFTVTGNAEEAQGLFLHHIDEAIILRDTAKSINRYQLTLDEAKVRLDMAISPGTWLMPSNLIMNMGSVSGYNNKLKQAGAGMKIGVNNDVNTSTKKVGVLHMEGGHSKINRPTGHPSNPIHKAAVAAQSGKKTVQSTGKTAIENNTEDTATSLTDTAHETNKIWLIAGLGLGAFALSRAL